jgi:hypothetical protein
MGKSLRNIGIAALVLAALGTGIYLGRKNPSNTTISSTSSPSASQQTSKPRGLVNIVKEDIHKKRVLESIENKERASKIYDLIPGYFQEIFPEPNELPENYICEDFKYYSAKEIERSFDDYTQFTLHFEDSIHIEYRDKNSEDKLIIEVWRCDEDVNPFTGLYKYEDYLKQGLNIPIIAAQKENKGGNLLILISDDFYLKTPLGNFEHLEYLKNYGNRLDLRASDGTPTI